MSRRLTEARTARALLASASRDRASGGDGDASELLIAPVVHRDHHASPDGLRVYAETELWRPELPALGWVLDHAEPGVIGSGSGFAHAARAARRLGAGGVHVTYLCSLRIDDGPQLPAADALSAAGTEVIGPETVPVLRTLARAVREVVCAWGELPVVVPGLRLAAETAAATLLTCGAELRCLGLTENGLPIHPRTAGATEAPLRPYPPLGPPTSHLTPLWRSA